MYIFIALTILNVVLQTIKSLCTIRCNKLIASIVNCVTYGVYTFVIFYTTSGGMSLWLKALITAIANFIGVYAASWAFDKLFVRDVLCKVELSIPKSEHELWCNNLKLTDLSYTLLSTTDDARYFIYEVFCPTQAASTKLKSILPPDAKYNITECAKRL